MAALYADENFPYPVVTALQAAGHEVLTAQADGRADQKVSDAEVLARATSLGRAVLTHNRIDFFRLHRANPLHAGIVACKEDLDFPALAFRIDAALSRTNFDGQVIRVNKPNSSQVS